MNTLKCFALLILFMFIGTTCSANPVRLARLPIIFKGRISNEVLNESETKITRAIHIPLNGSLQVAEYISVDETVAVFNNILQNLGENTKKPQYKDAVKMLANELDVDMVICPVIQRCSEHVIRPVAMFNDTRLSSSITAELIIYDRRADSVVDKKTTRIYDNSYSKFGRASYLAGECFDNLIKETQLRQLIRSLK